MADEGAGAGGEGEAGAGGRRAHEGDAGDAQAPPKRPKLAKEEENLPGYRKFLLSGIQGIKQEVLQGQIDRLGIPYAKLWKARNKDTGQCWLKDNESFLKVFARRPPPLFAPAPCTLRPAPYALRPTPAGAIADRLCVRWQGCKCVLNGMKVRGKEMKLVPAPDEGEDAALRPAPSADERTLCHQVTPLCDMTYEDQVDFKRELLLGSLERVTRKLLPEAATGSGLEWLRQLSKGPVCPLEKMHHSPDLHGYRNKNEFTIGYAADGKPMVGFRFGRFADGNTNVGCADGVLHTPEEALGVARSLTRFLRDHQTLECWGPQNHTGVWRMVMVRHNRVGDVMVLVQYSSNNCSREDLDAALAKLKAFLLEEKAAGTIKLTSLFFQEHNEVGNRAHDDAAVTLAWGADAFSESILGLKFRISPSAFFQVLLAIFCRVRPIVLSSMREGAAGRGLVCAGGGAAAAAVCVCVARLYRG